MEVLSRRYGYEIRDGHCGHPLSVSRLESDLLEEVVALVIHENEFR